MKDPALARARLVDDGVRPGPARVPASRVAARTAARTGSAGPAPGTGRRRRVEVTPSELRDEPTSTSSCCSGRTSSSCVRQLDRPAARPRRARRLPRAQHARRRRSPDTRHPLADRDDIPSCTSPTSTSCSGTPAARRRRVIEHGIVDPGDALHRRAAARRRRRQRAGPARPGRRHRPAARARRRGAARRLRHGAGRSARASACDPPGDAARRPAAGRAARRAGPPPGLRAPGPLDLARACRCSRRCTSACRWSRSPRPRRSRRCRPEAGVLSTRPRPAAERPSASSLARPGRGPRCAGDGGPRGARWRATGSPGSSRDWDGLLDGGDPMRIAMVSPSTPARWPRSAASTPAARTCTSPRSPRRWPRRGHEVTVYTRRDDADLPERVPLAPAYDVVHVDRRPGRGRCRRTSCCRTWPRSPASCAPALGARAAGRRARALLDDRAGRAARRPRPARHPGGADLPRARLGQAAAPGRRRHQPAERGSTLERAAVPRGRRASSPPAPTRCSSCARLGAAARPASRSCRAASTSTLFRPRRPGRAARPAGHRLLRRSAGWSSARARTTSIRALAAACRTPSWSSPAARPPTSWTTTRRRAGCARWRRRRGVGRPGRAASAGRRGPTCPRCMRSADVVARRALVRAVRHHPAGGDGLRRPGGRHRGRRAARHASSTASPACSCRRATRPRLAEALAELLADAERRAALRPRPASRAPAPRYGWAGSPPTPSASTAALAGVRRAGGGPMSRTLRSRA